MEKSTDFIQRLGEDMSIKILMCLEDPCDLVRASFVSRSWRHFVIANGLCKNLCLRLFPETSHFTHVTGVQVQHTVAPGVVKIDDSAEWAYLQREHKAYASLGIQLTTLTEENCISNALFASSTDNYPQESICNTIQPNDRIETWPSYWSSSGAANPAATETLVYLLVSRLCLVTEVHVHPFQAYFQPGHPIYSAKAVRFWMGHPKVHLDGESESDNEFMNLQDCLDHKFEWKYCSPEFPMAQDNCLQKFKLPKPVLCIGGILKVELLGRVQTQEMDGLYYICITHVQAVGRSLSPVFEVELIDNQGKCTLSYNPEKLNSSPPEFGEAGPSSRSHFQRFSESVRTWEQMILSTFRGGGPLMIDDYDSDFEYLD